MADHSYRSTARKRRPNGALVVSIAIICALTVALGAVCAYTVVTNKSLKEMQSTVSTLQSQLADYREGASDYLAQLEEKDATIAEQKDKIEEQQGTIDQQKDQIEEQQDKIDKQQDTIDDLKVQIALRDTAPGDPNLPVIGPVDNYEGQKIVALTFDDGPGPYTEELLDFLKQEGVRATFFVLGTRVDSYPRLIRRMAAEGHEVGNHSNAHNMLNRMDLVGVRKEMGACAEKIEKLLGYRPSVMRCPGGNTSATVTQYAQEAGIPIAYWSVDTRDWESRNKDAILNVAFGKNGIKDGSIVLMHDIYKTTVEAAKEMILRLKAEGYVFVTTSELIEARRGGIVAGKQYS